MIKNIINNKKYVGQTRSIKDRWNEHIKNLTYNRHGNTYLQRAWNKYGKDNFQFLIIEEVKDENKLTEREQYWIDFYKTRNLKKFGYNLRDAQDARYQGEETKQKIKDSMMGRMKGEKNPAAKLNEKKVSLIVADLINNTPILQVSKKYNISVSTLRNIIHGRSWNEISGGPIDNLIGRKKKKEIIKKGINKNGENNPNSKLDKDKVVQIVQLIKAGEKIDTIAKMYNVSISTIVFIRNGKSWLDVTGGPITDQKKENLHSNAKLTTKDILKIVEMIKNKISISDISKQFNVSYCTINRIKNGSSYSHITNGLI